MNAVMNRYFTGDESVKSKPKPVHGDGKGIMRLRRNTFMRKLVHEKIRSLGKIRSRGNALTGEMRSQKMRSW